MKISELKKVVESAGLEWALEQEADNNIMQVWWPYRNSGIVLDSKIYDNLTLTREDVERINAAYRVVAEFCAFDAEVQLSDYYYFEFNAISSITIVVREGKERVLNNKEMKTDFEMDKTSHRANKPYEIDMKAGYKVYDMFRNVSLKKHEKQKVLDGLQDLMLDNNIHGRQQILLNLATFSNFLEPIKFALDSHHIDITFMVEETINNNVISGSQMKRLFKLLSTYKTMIPIDLRQGKGYLPEDIVDSPMTMKQVCNNWEFVLETKERILVFLIQNEQLKALKIFMNNYTPFMVTDYIDIVEQFLVLVTDKKQVTFFLENWVDITEFYDDIIDDLDFFVVRMERDNLRLVIEKLYDVHPRNLFISLVDAFSESNAFSELDNASILDLFIDDPKVDLTYGGGYVVKVFNNNTELKKKLLKVEGMTQTLIDNGEVDLLPNELKDVFIF